MMQQSGKEKIQFYAALFISSLFLIIPAIYNHFPLVNPDAATYLASGFKPETPFDRPITYGLLIRLFSLNGLSLWPVVFIQGWIVSWLIFKIITSLTPVQSPVIYGLSTILFLSLFTPLSWLLSQVQPDVFTSITCLCIVLLLVNMETKGNRILLFILFFISVAAHMSHPLLFSGLLLCLLLFRKLFVPVEHLRKTSIRITVLIGLSLSSIAIMGSALSKSKHVFFMGSLLEKGVLKTYLDDNCTTHNYKLCAYKNELPKTFDDFLWGNNSPLYKVGDWQGSKVEFNKITHDVLTTPKYLGLLLKATASQTIKQAITFNIGDGNTAFPPGSSVHQYVGAYFPNEVNAFNSSKQNTSGIDQQLKIPNLIFAAIFVVSLLSILVLSVARWSTLSYTFKTLLFVVVAAAILNCLDCAAFSVVNGRYGCKMIWLIPLCLILYCVQLLTVKRTATYM